MTVDPVPTRTSGRANTGDVLLDGLIAGALGALTAALWFLVLDLAAGRPLRTPALLGTALLHRGAAAPQAGAVAPLEVAAYTAFHVLVFFAIGIGFSWLMMRFERFPILGFVLLVLFLCLQLGFFFLEVALGAQLPGQLSPWSVMVANLLAAGSISLYLWKRHPRIAEGLRHIWDDEP